MGGAMLLDVYGDGSAIPGKGQGSPREGRCSPDETSRRIWLEIANGFERLVDQAERVWRVEWIKPKKKPR